MISSLYNIRNQNEALVLKSIIEQDPISRASLSEHTKLNKASISSIVKTLMDDHLVFETGIGDSSATGGRKPILLEFNSKAGTILSVDLGHDSIDLIATYLNGEVIHEAKIRKTPISSENVETLLFSLIDNALIHLPNTPKGILGCAISIHGITNENKIIFSPNYDLDNIDLHHILSDQYHFPFFLENEANLAALGEYTFISRADDLLCVSIHSGIGLGIISDGELHRGKHGSAGEIGHTILFPSGVSCRCGNQGCLEKYASQKAIYEKISKALNIDENLINSDTIVQYLKNEQRETVLPILEECATHLSVALNNLLLFHDPEVLYIDSSIYEKVPELLDTLKKKIKNRFAAKTKIKTSTFAGQSSLYGGVTLVLRERLNLTPFKMYRNR